MCKSPTSNSAPATCSTLDNSGLPGEATWERSRKCSAPCGVTDAGA